MEKKRDDRDTCWFGVASFWLAVIYLALIYLFNVFVRGHWHIVPNEVVAFEILPFILGIISLLRIRRNPGELKGAGWAVAGIAICALTTAFLLHNNYSWRKTMLRASCRNNLRQLSTAMDMYAGDWNGRLPQADNWNEAVAKYLRNDKIWACPAALDRTVPSYAMNRSVAGKRRKDLRYSTVLLFESTPGRNLTGGSELLPSPPRHKDGYNVCFAVGRADAVSREVIDKLRWGTGD